MRRIFCVLVHFLQEKKRNTILYTEEKIQLVGQNDEKRQIIVSSFWFFLLETFFISVFRETNLEARSVHHDDATR